MLLIDVSAYLGSNVVRGINYSRLRIGIRFMDSTVRAPDLIPALFHGFNSSSLEFLMYISFSGKVLRGLGQDGQNSGINLC